AARARAAFTRAAAAAGRASTMRHAAFARLAELDVREGRLPSAEARLAEGEAALDAWRASLSDRELRLAALELAADGLDADLGIATVIGALAAGGRTEAAFGFAERRRARELAARVAQRQVLRDGAASPRPGSIVGESVTLDALQAGVPAGTALLFYVTGRGFEPTTAFVVTRAAARAVRLAPVDSLATTIRRLDELLAGGGDGATLAEALGSALLAPLGLGAEVSALVIVPDGALHHVPWDALRVDGRPAAARWAITLSPSASLAAGAWQGAAPARAGRVVAVGDPSLADSLRTALSLAELPAARREARAVSRFGVRRTVLLGRGATEAAVKAAAREDVSVLHLATHAEVDDGSSGRTLLALGAGDGDDGVLRPEELAALDLDGALVALSACRTGRGRVLTGEGVDGLTGPALEAGAGAVLVTRWRVADGTMADLMRRWYGAMAQGATAGEALARVKRDAIAEGRPATAWASLALVGDGRMRPALQVPSRGTATTVALLAAFVAVAGGLAAGYSARRSGRGGDASTRPSAKSARTDQT
ncbi:MAG: CHAT domain-containing protein, partial [Gemmatimonadales bacterium]|nr:CHAT domain-containing protein [Gemmatimonadales bacterium]